MSEKKNGISANDVEVADIVENARAHRQEVCIKNQQDHAERASEHLIRQQQMLAARRQKHKRLASAAVPVIAAGLMAVGMYLDLVAPVVAIPWAGVNCMAAAVRFDRYIRKYHP